MTEPHTYRLYDSLYGEVIARELSEKTANELIALGPRYVVLDERTGEKWTPKQNGGTDGC